ncbi:MAG: MBL fold metallo-hydrolase [Deltaproteobacteria bacterium]|nr:MBL fold metallo-hydrolase [Deltaproteobacteria bacterium]
MSRTWLGHLRWALLALCLGCPRNTVPPPTSRPTLATVDIIAVGHGDAILVTSAAGKRLLIDGGEAEAAPVVLARLRSRFACPLDLILLSHPHADHLGGLARVMEDCGARLYMDGGYRHDSRLYARLLEVVEELGIPLLRAEAGRQIDLGSGVVLTLLGPPRPFLEEGADGVNASSVVTRLQVGRSSVLFAGDATAPEENWLLGQGVGLRSTVLKVGHHGSRSSSTAGFLAAVAPRLAVISNWPNAPKHPHPETLERLRAVKAQVLETAREGTITIELDGEGVTWSSVNHPRKVPLP